MARALELADLARGRTSPNPAVGAVVVKDGLIRGEGFTQPAGSWHAEVEALRRAGADARGADLYVTLEPCCHHGRTPPCTDAIVAAGVATVHAATLDPNPKVSGGGVRAIEAAGIRTIIGEREDAARRLNEPFFHFQQTGRPFVTVKWAMTLDGKIATRSGDARWISGPAARRAVHLLRDASDAIVVGRQTVVADDPRLTVRLDPTDESRPPRPRPPLRVVVDSQARIPPSSQLLSPELAAGTLVAATELAPAERTRAIRARGAEVALLPARDGRVDLAALLDLLGARGALAILVEGGGALLGSLVEAGLVDRVLVFVAPKVLGGERAPSPIGGRGVDRVAEAIGLTDIECEQVGDDWKITGRVAQTPSPTGRGLG